jgi:hypothetical protein
MMKPFFPFFYFFSFFFFFFLSHIALLIVELTCLSTRSKHCCEVQFSITTLSLLYLCSYLSLCTFIILFIFYLFIFVSISSFLFLYYFFFQGSPGHQGSALPPDRTETPAESALRVSRT